MMQRARSVGLAAALLGCMGCSRTEPTTSAIEAAPLEIETRTVEKPLHPRLAPRAPRALTAPRLPEDPVLAARTSAQTDERRANKKHKRYLAFDGENMAVHRALLALIMSARERYDDAQSEAALNAARVAMQSRLAKLDEGLAKLDSKSVGSRLLADYEALHAALRSSYPDAKLASLRGDAAALSAAQAGFDQRLQAMHAWLDEVEDQRKHATAQR